MLGILLLALVLGFGVGWLAVGRAQVPASPPAWSTSLIPPAPPLAPQAAEPPPPRLPVATDESARARTPSPAKVEVPTAEPAAPPEAAGFDPVAVSLIPRGPGRFAVLDLAAVDIPQVDVRQGQLVRNGAASWAQFAKRPRLTVLRGTQVRVEWLHVGFDREARPVVAHIRTTGHAGGEVEGVIQLRVGEVQLPVHADQPADGAE
jgi:hypothetical protein